MNATQPLSFIHKAKQVSLAGIGWKMNGRHLIALIGTILLVSLLISYLTPAYGLYHEAISKQSISKTHASNEKIVEQIDKIEFLKEPIKSVRSIIFLISV
jgi:hypothetical protein